jgi:hypothetical protein
MANVYSVLSMSLVAAVLMAGNVQAQSIPPEGSVFVIFTATPIPAPRPMPIGIGIGREFALVNQTRAISSSVGTAVINPI